MGCCYGNVKTVISQIAETGFLNDVGLCPEVGKRISKKSSNAYICNKNTHYFFLALICWFHL